MDANEVAARAWDLRVNMTRVALSILHHSADAEDAVADAMLNAYRKAEGLRNEEKVNAWLMRIVVNSCYTILRKRGREVPAEDMSEYDTPVLEGMEGSIFESIQQLPENYQKVLVLHYYEGFKAREIARILSMPLGTVVGQLARGRSKLKTILEMEGVVHGDEQAI